MCLVGFAEQRALAPLQRPTWLGAQAVQSLSLTSWRYVGPQVGGRVVPRFVDLPAELHDRKAFVVHDGGLR